MESTKNVLLVGNGFDIAHNLKTSYNDFLFLLKNWDAIYEQYVSAKEKEKVLNEMNYLKRYVDDIAMIESKTMKKFDEIIDKNSWIKYYRECGAEMDGWIDFEKEIHQVIDIFVALINGTPYNHTLTRVTFTRYCQQSGENIVLSYKYKVGEIRIKKKSLLDDLRREFNEFIETFELYLHEFVYKGQKSSKIKQIEAIKADYVISFNYTLTEKIYGIPDSNVHHIHGRIREDLNVGDNNMVLGINERDFENKEFLYYVKYFQRIQKRTGIKYKQFIDTYNQDVLRKKERDPFNLYIYGHSLDVTDEDVLRYVIGNKTKEGYIELKPRKVIFFYYSQQDYEGKIINLIDLYGRAAVEKCIENGTFEFRKTKNEKVEDVNRERETIDLKNELYQYVKDGRRRNYGR